MPLLGTFLFNVFAAFAAWLAKYLTQKVAVTVAMAGILTAMFAALYLAARTAIGQALSVAAGFDPMFGAGVGMVISPHSAALISGYITFWSLAELYKWKVNILQLWSRTI
ncbi:DUF5455 family protein [Pseudoduganella sp. RAF19]|uniref:DUF5455 family protein n=1 Tax=Pseudoduganella sp. RAF19 TaxID=3233052 RepID=UPI003F97C638